ncbi:DMT family transporter [Paucibacter sp. B2R-40]|uniref:DMT family transporter n=1 Tax=Paucibacter sp. B2R-40 TaxID=2893554 RepID=UPI0021E452F0|nr:DMT family transporter [Paucibacter sp. B2R-40]MCV2355810.1 DMT family transporter [Paucibacter sp. B2R-40]
MSHRRAVYLMLLVTLLWSTAGVVTRHLEAARGFELTFWRSGFNAIALMIGLRWLRGPALWAQLRAAPRLVWLSGLCWAVMFTAFMVALSLTSVSNVLVTMSLGPLLTALLSRLVLKRQLPARTWWAIAVAGAGIAWMFGHELGQGADSAVKAGGQGGQGVLGMLVALGVPLAAAVNWSVLQHVGHGKAKPEAADEGANEGADAAGDMPLAVLLGALISMLAMLPLAWPTQASPHDLSLLAGLGIFQLAIPCLLVVRLSRVLSGPELALLGQLELVLGVLWAWMWAGEDPTAATLLGGAMVLLALLANELLAWRKTLAANAGLQLANETKPLHSRREA